MQTFHLYCRCKGMLFSNITSAVRATAWLTVLDGGQYSIFMENPNHKILQTFWVVVNLQYVIVILVRV